MTAPAYHPGRFPAAPAPAFPTAAPLTASIQPPAKPRKAPPAPAIMVAARPAPVAAPKKMTFIDLHKQFYQLHRVQPFTAPEQSLYNWWLDQFNCGIDHGCTTVHWPEYMPRMLTQVAAALVMDKGAIERAALSLMRRGLMHYQPGTKYVPAAWTMHYQPATPQQVDRVRTTRAKQPVEQFKTTRAKQPVEQQVEQFKTTRKDETGLLEQQVEQFKTTRLLIGKEEDVLTLEEEEKKSRKKVVLGASEGYPNHWPAAQKKSPPVAPAPQEEVGPDPTPGPTASAAVLALAGQMAALFHVGPVTQAHGWMQIQAFCTLHEAENRLDYLRAQFEGFRGLKELTGQYVGSWRTYINAGTDPRLGKWNYTDYASELAALKTTPRFNGNHSKNPHGHAPGGTYGKTAGSARSSLANHNEGKQIGEPLTGSLADL